MDAMLFTPFTLRGVTFPNRVVIAPMQMYMAGPDGLATDWHFQHLAKYAVGGAGTVSNTVPGVWVAGNNTVEVSAKGSHLLVQVNGFVVMDTVTARFVAPFQPYITILSPPASPSIIVNSYNVSNPRSSSQIITAPACWGVVGGGGPNGGNGAVHDASGCINAVDMMVLDSIKFH